MVRILPEFLASPYLSGGVGLVLGRINDSVRSGFATDLGIGVETMVTRDVAINGGLGVRFVFPGDAVDLVDRSGSRSEEHTSELQSRGHLVCRLLLEKKKNKHSTRYT